MVSMILVPCSYKLNKFFGRCVYTVEVALLSCHHLYDYDTQTENVKLLTDCPTVDVFWWHVSTTLNQIQLYL